MHCYQNASVLRRIFNHRRTWDSIFKLVTSLNTRKQVWSWTICLDPLKFGSKIIPITLIAVRIAGLISYVDYNRFWLQLWWSFTDFIIDHNNFHRFLRFRLRCPLWYIEVTTAGYFERANALFVRCFAFKTEVLWHQVRFDMLLWYLDLFNYLGLNPIWRLSDDTTTTTSLVPFQFSTGSIFCFLLL